MGKRLLGLFLAAIVVSTAFAGCAGSSKSDNRSAGAAETTAAAAAGVNYGIEAGSYLEGAEQKVEGLDAYTNDAAEKPKDGKEADSIGGNGNASQNVSNAILSERKVIRSANISVEVENYDEAYSRIDNMLLGIGFIQSTNINTEKYYKKDGSYKLLRHGTITLRVDRNQFDKILNNLKGIGEVLSWNINGQDVTDKYFDTESRLRLYRIEEAKLEEYLKKLNDLDQIFRTESRLTEIRYQIESLTGNLKKMSDLVELSTISITMNEKRPESDKPAAPPTYGQKLLNNFLESLEGVSGFLGDLIIFLVAAIPVLILVGLFVLLGVLIYRKLPKRKLANRLNSSIDKAEEK